MQVSKYRFRDVEVLKNREVFASRAVYNLGLACIDGD